jgi:hypothetical protein
VKNQDPKKLWTGGGYLEKSGPIGCLFIQARVLRKNETRGRVGKRVDSIDKGKQNEIRVLAKKNMTDHYRERRFF